jgi:nicotinamide mononucleotide adenylyltransferase
MCDRMFSDALDPSKLLSWDAIETQQIGGHHRALGILVACGSYNPIHTAHCQLFDFAKRRLEATPQSEGGKTPLIVGAFASPVNDAYGKAGLAPFAHRAEIVRRVVASSPLVTLDAWEGNQTESQRSYLVLSHIIGEVRKFYLSTARTDVERDRSQRIEVYFLCGGDLFQTFYYPGVWKLALLRKIFTEFRIVVAARSDSKHPLEVVRGATAPLTHPDEPGVLLDLREMEDRITVFELPPNDISSTMIRGLLAKGLAVDEAILPKAAAEYCVAHRVYSGA